MAKSLMLREIEPPKAALDPPREIGTVRRTVVKGNRARVHDVPCGSRVESTLDAADVRCVRELGLGSSGGQLFRRPRSRQRDVTVMHSCGPPLSSVHSVEYLPTCIARSPPSNTVFLISMSTVKADC